MPTCNHRKNLLRNIEPCDHVAHLYVNTNALVEAVHWHADAAFRRGAALVMLAVEHHAERMLPRLAESGYEVEGLRASGQLVIMDAHHALKRILLDERPDKNAFEAAVRPVIEDAQRVYGDVAVYGELVDVLWQRGKRDAAEELEVWWNDLIAEYRFSLLCAYKADPLDFHEETQIGINDVCRTHTHVVPVADYNLFEVAVDNAMQHVFHNGDSGALKRHFLERCPQTTQMPIPQAVLLGLHEILPSLAQTVRMAARDAYLCSNAGDRANEFANRGAVSAGAP